MSHHTSDGISYISLHILLIKHCKCVPCFDKAKVFCKISQKEYKS